MVLSTETFRATAASIAVQIAEAAIQDGEGVFWRTASARPDRAPDWIATPTLYNGVAGIAAFLLEAAHVLGEQRYLELALAGLKWAEKNSVVYDHSFYSGRLGIAWVMIRAYRQTGDGEWLERALRISLGCERFIVLCEKPDLLYGLAGTLLGLLHLHVATGLSWVVDLAELSLRRLLDLSRWTAHGLTWCADAENIRGLCGLSHGNSGMAFAILEASRYFGQPGLETVTREAFCYENRFFDPDSGTWPDFRKLGHYDDEGFAREYGGNPPSFFVEPGQFDTWCHGSPGIGMARARAVELLGTEWRSDLEHALHKTRKTNAEMERDALSLCHGLCGNAFVFLEAARVLNDPVCHAHAEDAAWKTLESKERLGYFASGYRQSGGCEDLSLMMGNAGIGYFFLNLIDPDLPSPLLPRLPQDATMHCEGWSDGSVARMLAGAILPRTMSLINTHEHDEASSFFSAWRSREEIIAFARTAARQMDGGSALAALESAKVEMYDQCPSFALAHYQRWAAGHGTAGLKRPGDLVGMSLRLVPYVKIWRYGDSSHLLSIDGTEVVDQPLTPLADCVLSCFEKTATMSDALRAVADQFPDGEVDMRVVTLMVERQILAAIEARFLESATDRR